MGVRPDTRGALADLNGDLVRAAYHNRPDDVRNLLEQGADATAFAANLWPIAQGAGDRPGVAEGAGVAG